MQRLEGILLLVALTAAIEMSTLQVKRRVYKQGRPAGRLPVWHCYAAGPAACTAQQHAAMQSAHLHAPSALQYLRNQAVCERCP